MNAYQTWVCAECGEEHDRRSWAEDCCADEVIVDPNSLPPTLLVDADEAAGIEYMKLMQEAEARGQLRL